MLAAGESHYRAPGVGELLGQDLLAGVFYAVYGPTDAAFGLFFAWVWWRSR